jgi:uncharacterized membrane protein YccC
MTCDQSGTKFAPSFRKLSASDVVYSIGMGIACAMAYKITTSLLASATGRGDDLLGGMWAAVAAAFVFRDKRADSLAAGVSRLVSTCVSFALCLLYLGFLPPVMIGIPILVIVGTLVMILLNRHDDIITTAITTIVVMGVAIISPEHAWTQPLLRLCDTVIGIIVGVALKRTVSAVCYLLRFKSVKEKAEGRNSGTG